MKLEDTSVYYSPARICSYNAPVNIIIGERSEGKTYAFKKLGIKNYLNKGQTWVYCRRYDTVLKEMLRQPFFGDIMANDEFPGIEFRVDGKRMQLRREGHKSWETFGYFASLNRAQAYKGTTDATCSMLVYDEFINEKRVPPYLPNEPTMLMNFWETLDRREDRVRIFLVANAADLVNPFFLEWGIIIEKPGIRRYKNGLLVVQWDDNPAFAEKAANSNIGRFTAGTSYDEYARGNFFIGGGDEFIEKKPQTAKPKCILQFQDQKYGIWDDLRLGHYYITRKLPSKAPTYSLTTADHRPNLIMLEHTNPFLKALVQHYRYGMLFFDSPATREGFLLALRFLGHLR